MSNFRNRLALAALALTSVLVTLGILGVMGEVAVRYRERHRTTMPGTMPLLYYRHGRLGHALVRDNDYFGWVHVNSEGFRGTQVSRSQTPGTFRILVLGGSTVFDGMVSADSMVWTTRMQRWVQQLVPDRSVEVINAGVPGYRVTDQTISLLIGASRFEADLAILYDGNNDLFANLRSSLTGWGQTTSKTPNEVGTKTPWVRWFERHSLLYVKLVDKLQAIRFAASGKSRGTNASATTSSGHMDYGAARFENDLSAFVSVAHSFGLKVVLASPTTVSSPDDTIPIDKPTSLAWQGAVPFAAPSEVLRGFAEYRQVFQRVAVRYSVPLISSERFGIWGRRLYAREDPSHFNDAGAACMGRKMAYALLDAGLLPVRSRTASRAVSPSALPASEGCQGQ